jgi:predicted RNA polymerase sigma factor
MRSPAIRASAVALAWAEIANNRPAAALAILKPVLASAYVSADQHVAAAQAHLLMGHDREAQAERKAALAINPHALDRDAALVWFGH